ncbi:MAG: NTP transferase domain-containing protein [Deltaproteobacteria bacterium]|nr:NTP transferase domain-containing protein [Deltaproteobacteria bacterium]
MKGIILAGGTGSRLYPLTKVTNKHLLPVGKKPMILHPVEKLVGAGVHEILVVTGVEHMGDVVSLLGSGKDFNCHFTYRVQDEAGGIAQALGLAESFAGSSAVTVILGDNIFADELGPFATRFHEQRQGAKILLKEVQDPSRFGVAEVRDGKVVGIVEKPSQPKSTYAVTGIYFYDPDVFRIIRTLRPSHRGELEITDVNNHYISQGQMTYELLKGAWTDAGTFESLHLANTLMLQE